MLPHHENQQVRLGQLLFLVDADVMVRERRSGHHLGSLWHVAADAIFSGIHRTDCPTPIDRGRRRRSELVTAVAGQALLLVSRRIRLDVPMGVVTGDESVALPLLSL